MQSYDEKKVISKYKRQIFESFRALKNHALTFFGEIWFETPYTAVFLPLNCVFRNRIECCFLQSEAEVLFLAAFKDDFEQYTSFHRVQLGSELFDRLDIFLVDLRDHHAFFESE